MAKGSKAQVAARLEEVIRIRLDGAQHHDICQYASEKGWGLSDRQVRRYTSQADKLLAERREKNRKLTVALSLARREALYARAVNAGDYRTALAILTDKDKLQGFYPADKEIRELARLTAQQEKRVRELEAKIDSGQRDSATTPTNGQAAGPTPTVGGDARPDAI